MSIESVAEALKEKLVRTPGNELGTAASISEEATYATTHGLVLAKPIESFKSSSMAS